MDRRRFLVGAAVGAGIPGAVAAAPMDLTLQVDAAVLCRTAQAAIEYAMASTLRALRLTAASRNADLAQWQDIAPMLAALALHSPSQLSGWLAMPDGSYRSAFDGEPAPDNLKGKPFFRDLMAGRAIECQPLISAVSGQRALVSAVPIIRGGRVIAALGAEVVARRVMETVDGYYSLPPAIRFVVLNDAGLIVLHSNHELIFTTPVLTEPSVAVAVNRILTGESGIVAYRQRGQRHVAVFSRSAALGWRFIVAKTDG